MNNNELKEKVTEMVLADPNMLESLKALYEELSHVEPAKEQKPDMMYVLTQKVKVVTDTEEEIYHYHPLVGECLLIPGAEKNRMICSANLLELQNVQHSPMLTGFGVQQGSLQILALKPDDFELLQLLLDETITAIIVMSTCDSEKRTPTPLGLKFGIAVINRSIRRSCGLSENMVIVFSPCCEIKKALRFLCNRRAIDSITYSVVVLIPVQRSAARLQERGIRP